MGGASTDRGPPSCDGSRPPRRRRGQGAAPEGGGPRAEGRRHLAAPGPRRGGTRRASDVGAVKRAGRRGWPDPPRRTRETPGPPWEISRGRSVGHGGGTGRGRRARAERLGRTPGGEDLVHRDRVLDRGGGVKFRPARFHRKKWGSMTRRAGMAVQLVRHRFTVDEYHRMR